MARPGSEQGPFTHPTILVNPKYESQGNAVLARLRQTGYEPTVLHTEQTVPGTTEVVANHYACLSVDPAQSPLLVVGGDGSVDLARRALVTPAVHEHTSGKTALSSVGGGFARDHRRDTHGDLPKDPARILRRSVIVPARWIDIQIDHDGHKQPMEATLYTGIGKTARGAALANTGNRATPKIDRALRIGLGTIFDDATFRATLETDNTAKTVTPRTLAEITISTSGSMSMIGRFPTVLWKDELHLLTVRPGRFWATVALARLVTGISDGHNVPGPVTVTVHSDTSIQHDGEPPHTVAGGSTITAQLSDKTYPLLTSRQTARLFHAVTHIGSQEPIAL